ncbi:type II secretion system minor pseudopilin GspH [Indioceanicola profundi]|uniref:type II secretion system minor pseudopilin GspH n=1 Tax=Indioceanicola profundi TaxID=2220096 RepID=UPI0013C4BC05|nr:type II secretion system minor pseudopilin GspH [Indioceanicola profundi]
MPISATGNNRRAGSQGGFTLIELLVVMAVIGLLSGVVVMTWPPADPPALADARRFAADARQAAEASIVTGRPYGLALDGRGWTVLRADAAGWTPLPDVAPGLWSDGVQARPTLSGAKQAAGDSAPAIPALRFDPVGLATPFALRVEGDGASALVEVDAAGRVALRAGEEG